jgi:hypothetical protein
MIIRLTRIMQIMRNVRAIEFIYIIFIMGLLQGFEVFEKLTYVLRNTSNTYRYVLFPCFDVDSGSKNCT